MESFKTVDETYTLLEQDKIDMSRQQHTKQNLFTTRPLGILLQDSYNNPFFPIYPRPRIDTSNFDLMDVYKRFREMYIESKSLYLPWHYCIEFIQDRYYVFNTRPIDMKFPLTTDEALTSENTDAWDSETEVFMEERIFDVSEAIHICVIGNSDQDVYTKKLYSLIGNTCISPIVRYHRLPGGLYQRIFGLNLGKRFQLNTLIRYVTK